MDAAGTTLKPTGEVRWEYFCMLNDVLLNGRQVKKSTLNPNAHEFKPRFNAQVSPTWGFCARQQHQRSDV